MLQLELSTEADFLYKVCKDGRRFETSFFVALQQLLGIVDYEGLGQQHEYALGRFGLHPPRDQRVPMLQLPMRIQYRWPRER